MYTGMRGYCKSTLTSMFLLSERKELTNPLAKPGFGCARAYMYYVIVCVH